MKYKALLIVLILSLNGCCEIENNPIHKTTITIIGNPKVGSSIYHNGNWWKITKISTNGNMSFTRFCELTKEE